MNRPWVWIPVTMVVALALGASVAINPQLGLLMLGAMAAVLALGAPAPYWAAAALLAALTFRGFVTLGLLPGVATFLDIPLCWGALAAATIRRPALRGRVIPREVRNLMLAIAGLAGAVFTSWAVHPSELFRPILYLLLLGEPFVLIAALRIDPPSERLASMLKRILLAILVVQVPIVVWQAFILGGGDLVKGTLHGAGAGHHAIGAVGMVGGLWVLLNPRLSSLLRVPLGLALMSIPLLSDAKQVMFAAPALLLGMRLRDLRRSWLPLITAASLLTAVFVSYSGSRAAFDFIQQARQGRGGKSATAVFVWERVTTDFPSLLAGKGPAQTVSRAAFMTTDRLLGQDSPLRFFGLEVAETAEQAHLNAREISGGRSSFNNSLSSALGVLGDLGLIGVGAYLLLWGLIFSAVRRVGGPEGIAAAGGFAMFFLLGFVYDWWEQPPFSVFLAVLTALALTRSRTGGDDSPSHLHRR